MPDKNQGIESFEQKFVDQAWSQMNDLLDREKPVVDHTITTSRWTYVGLTLLVFLFGLFSGAVLYSLSGHEKEGTAYTDQEIMPEISAIPSGSDRYSSISQKDLIDFSNVNASLSTAEPKNVFGGFSFGQSSSYTTDHKPVEDISLKPLDNNTPLFPQVFEDKIAGPIEITGSVTEPYSYSIELENESKKPDPAIGLKTGINVMRDNIFAGYYGGLIAQYPLSGAILVNTGLLYTSLQPEESIRYATSSLGSASNKSSSNYAILKEMEYVSLPVGLSFQPFQFLRFSSGINLSYLLNSESYYASLADNPYAQGRENNISLAFRENAWNNLDVSMMYGLTLFPTQNWGVDFSYNVGMMDFSKNRLMHVKDNDKHNFYQISIMYYFLHK